MFVRLVLFLLVLSCLSPQPPHFPDGPPLFTHHQQIGHSLSPTSDLTYLTTNFLESSFIYCTFRYKISVKDKMKNQGELSLSLTLQSMVVNGISRKKGVVCCFGVSECVLNL